MMKEFLDKIKNNPINPLYLILSTEKYIIDSVINSVKEKLSITGNLDVVNYDLTEQSINELVSEANEMSFFSEKQLFIVKNPFFLINERIKTDVTYDLDVLIDYLNNPNPDTVMIFIGPYNKLDERKKITKVFRKNVQILEFNKQKNNNIFNSVSQYISDNQIRISKDAKEELLFLTGNSLTLTINELKKLQMYKLDEEITKQDVINLVPKTLEHLVFDLMDYLLNNQKQRALNLYHDLLLEGEETIKINYILIMQIRLMIQIKMLQKQNYNYNDIASSLKVHPYRVKKSIQQINNVSLKQLAIVFNMLVDFEEMLKSKNIDGQAFFEIILSKIDL